MNERVGWIIAGILILVILCFGVYKIGYSKSREDVIQKITNTGKVPVFVDVEENNITKQIEDELILSIVYKQYYDAGYQKCVNDVRGLG